MRYLARMSTTNGLTAKQEAFCREYLRCGNASAAYRLAYNAENMRDKQIWEEACKLKASPKVSQRIGELEEQAAIVATLDRAKVLHMLVETYNKAIQCEQTGPAARCAELIGKAMAGGMFTDKHQVGQDVLTREQIIEQLAEGDPVRRKLAERLLNAPRSFQEGASQATRKRFGSTGTG